MLIEAGHLSLVYTGILIQILIQIGCVYTLGMLDSNPDLDHLSHVDCDADSNLDSGPGARVNTPLFGGYCCYLLECLTPCSLLVAYSLSYSLHTVLLSIHLWTPRSVAFSWYTSVVDPENFQTSFRVNHTHLTHPLSKPQSL